MDSISRNSANSLNSASLNPSDLSSTSGSKLPTDVRREESPFNSKFTDLSKITQAAKNSLPEIRKEAIDRAKLLLNDPNFLNDRGLEKLANRLDNLENF